MRVHGLLAIAGVVAMVASASLEAQPLKVTARGAKRVTISDRVGKNQFTWDSDAPMEKIKGTAEGVSGSFTIDPQNLSSIRGTVSASVATMKTGNATRDGHLKSGQWLDAARYPTISFTISSVSGIKVTGNKATGTATGTFSMHGVSKQISIPFSVTYLDESAATKKKAPGDLVMVTADFSVSLKDFKVAGAQGIVGSKVGETIKVKAQLFGATS
jgi:polyisoprenoid-binding protein YceI